MDVPFQFIELPPERSQEKPRTTGLTMAIDWGVDLMRVDGMMKLVGPYLDIIKIPIATSRLYSSEMLAEKFEIYRANDVKTFVGGGFVEHVFADKGMAGLPQMFTEAKRVGFDILEISDNYIPLSTEERQTQIKMAIDAGLTVYGEVGSKYDKNDAGTLARQIDECLDAGAKYVLLEGAEFYEDGKIKQDLIDGLDAATDLKKTLVEVPGPWVSGVSWWMVQDLVKILIKGFGPDVNLGNIMLDDVLHTEALRVGLGVVQPTERGAETA